jgi:hypothetical protein
MDMRANGKESDSMKETQPLVKNGTVLELPARRVPTEAQREASRRNARRSTGPRSMRGKAASSMNAIKHGVFAREAVLRTKLADESRDEFEKMLERIRESFAPQDAFERMLVDKMVRALWRLRRLHRFERALAEEDLHRFEKLVNILRYAAALEREWTRCYAMLEHRKQQAARGEDAPPLYLSLRL